MRVVVVQGSWDGATGILTLDEANPIVWADGTTATPSDAPVRHIKRINSKVQFAIIGVSAVTFAMSLALHVLLVKYRQWPVIKASNPVFCHLIVGGSLLAYGVTVADGIDVSSTPAVSGVVLSCC